jgi:hypothetical protein
MSASGFDEVEPSLNAFKPRIETVHAAVNAHDGLLHMRRPHFQILHIVDHPIQTLFNARQPRLNLLKDRNHDVRDFRHDFKLPVPDLFCKFGVVA